MKRKTNILAAFLALVLIITLSACSVGGGDNIERFAQAEQSNGESIDIPGYEKLSFEADKKTQTVNLKNPANNACTFVLTLTLDDGTTLWTGEAISPGEAFTRITLNKALNAGEYAATLHYDCYTLKDNQPLNGADIQLNIEVK